MTNAQRDLFKAVIEEILGGGEKPETSKEVPTETKDFKSLVSKEEFEAIVKLKEAMENYIEVHNNRVLKGVKDIIEADEYAEAQYLMLQDVVNEAMKFIGMMYTIHTVDKKSIDDLAKELDTDVKGFCAHLVVNHMTEKLGL